MKDLMGLMSKAKEMQAKMQGLQEEMETVEATGVSGGGAVTVRLNGKGNMLGVSIDESLVKPGEGEIIEDLILAAHNDAKTKVEAIMAEKTKALTSGMGLPAGLKLPF
jgi:DNA-binding YbaB/EbfC family protein